MNKSESIKEIAMALIQAQARIGNALKNKDNPFHKSKYADLEAVWDAAAGPLRDNKLAVVQMPLGITSTEKGIIVDMETMLIHDSGEYISSIMSIPTNKYDPQAYGSALTYARRYALAALLGITQSDDDGERARDGTADTLDSINCINGCTNVEELKKVFQSKFTSLDAAGKKHLTEAKDKKKAELTNGSA